MDITLQGVTQVILALATLVTAIRGGRARRKWKKEQNDAATQKPDAP